MQVKSKVPTPLLYLPDPHSMPTCLERLFLILRIEFYRGVETSGCYVAELDEKVVGIVAFEKKVKLINFLNSTL